tara:strand:- start:1186 stop:1809 length:624 start_codon:yes stop_codon:yes gene_type:complete
MDFIEKLDALMPDYLTDENKNRLREGLRQFTNESIISKNYTDFYSTTQYDFFLQGDLIRQLRFPVFDFKKGNYSKKYFDALVVSNTCDIDKNNNQKIPKEVLLAKAIPLDEYILDLKKINVEKIDEKIIQIKKQFYSNLLYLPPTKNSKEYIVLLDDICQISRQELNNLMDDIPNNRIDVLDHFGYYLFVFKLSYHLCRLPEEHYRN